MKILDLASLSGFALAVTQEQEQAATQSLEKLWNPSNRARAPNAVRFGFHSCFEFGCNGCLDLTNPGNKGLEETYALLNEIYENELPAQVPSGDTIMSRADFWALAAWNAMTATLDPDFYQQADLIGMKYGRVDCPTSPVWPNNRPVSFPDERLGVAEIRRSFGAESIFGFTDDEAVALIGGGHSLGQAHLENSGYQGPWDDSPLELDAEYFEELVEENWVQRKTSMDKHQFNEEDFEQEDQDEDAIMMLNSDMALLKNIVNFDSETGVVTGSCRVIEEGSDICPDSVLAGKTREYAEGGSNLLVPDFLAVYHKLLTTTEDNLVLQAATGTETDPSEPNTTEDEDLETPTKSENCQCKKGYKKVMKKAKNCLKSRKGKKGGKVDLRKLIDVKSEVNDALRGLKKNQTMSKRERAKLRQVQKKLLQRLP